MFDFENDYLVKALGVIGRPTLPLLIRACKEDDIARSVAAEFAMEAVGESVYGIAYVREAFLEAVRDDEREVLVVRQAAAEALKKIQGKQDEAQR